ncbi:MAG: glyceraldehyde-3-phosphate dehydrogenase [Saprospiraceae bacterium]|nr:glyceraldehyde-3-phosphate dehydrogenase [Saprospiraceae bacterium]
MIPHSTLIQEKRENTLIDWREKEKKALELLQITGALRFDRSIELVFFREDIYDARPSEVLHLHRVARNYMDMPIPVEITLEVARGIQKMKEIPAAMLDIGKLASEWMQFETSYPDMQSFIGSQLGQVVQSPNPHLTAKDVILYGLGRIGRIAARRIISTTGRGDQLRLRAIVIRPSLEDRYLDASKRAALLLKDSVHGDFHGTVEVAADGSELIINGNSVHLIHAKNPEDIDYTEYGISDAMVIDNTGVWRDKAGLSRHMRPGVSQVLFTAPGKDIPNVVYGVNHAHVDFEKEQVFCAASCTTNAIVPILKVMDDAFTIQRGHIESVHAYTSDQNLLDNFHKKPRRGRAAAMNMVLTSTGAATAVAKVLPHLSGKLTGNAVRVPTPNVSLAIMVLTLEKPTTVDAVNDMIRKASLTGDLVEQIHYSADEEYVSTHAVGMTSTSVLDAPSTIVSADGHTVTIYAWYDNEFGYTCQVLRLAKHAAKVRRPSYY